MPRPRLLHRSNKSSHQKRGTNSTNKNNNLLKYSSVTPQQNSKDENDNISDLSSDANPDYYQQQNNSTTKTNELQTKIENLKQFFGTFSEIFNGKIIKRILTMIILAITCSAIIRFTLVLDLDKTVPKHEPGSCKIIQDFKKTPGGKSGYLEYVEEIQTLFITRQPYKSKINETLTSSIHVVHLSSEYLQSSTDKSSSTLLPDKIQAIKLQIENFKPEKFSPLGLSASISSKNHVLLYVINDFDSYFGQTIEVFKYLQKDEKLIHLKTIKNRDFQSLIDVKVVADGGDRFFAVNNFYFKNPYLQKLEILSQWKSGNLIFFDGKKSTIIDSSISTPSSIALDKEQSRLYVGSFLGEMIKSYQLNKDYSIKQLMEIGILSSPTKIQIEKQSGNLWIASQPILYKSLQNQFWNNKTIVPSHVIRIRFQENQKSWVTTEPFANDGTSLSNVNGLALMGEKLAIGSFNGKIMICDVINFNLA